MSNNKKHSIETKRAAKKAAVLKAAPQTGRRWLIGGAVVLGILVAGSIFYLQTRDGNLAANQTATESREFTATELTYPVNLFDDGKVRYFEYRTAENTIKYFILKSSDGVIRAAFDACDVCWPAGKGYQQSGDVMVCRNCGRKFASLRINEVKGGCNPAPLARDIRNDQIVIQVDDILAGESYFNFEGKV